MVSSLIGSLKNENLNILKEKFLEKDELEGIQVDEFVHVLLSQLPSLDEVIFNNYAR